MRFAFSTLSVFVATTLLAVVRFGLSITGLKTNCRIIQARSQISKYYSFPNIEASYRNYLADEIGVTNFTNAEYNTNNTVLVNQFFSYVPRISEEETVVKAFKRRQELRIMNPPGDDKKCNRLIAVSGSPGIGKSTFLANLPCSASFREYCPNPIVAPFTFNSGMSATLNGNPTVGLRILFGAAWCMYNATRNTTSWSLFLENFERYANTTAIEAVNTLKNVYGPRRLILLVDEILRAPTSSAYDVTQSLSQVLDEDANTDVIMTSLSNEYIESLIVNSRRIVEFIVLPTIQDSTLGKEECREWADEAIRIFNVTDNFNMNLLRSAYLLASGHPRSIEYLVMGGFNRSILDPCWSNTRECLINRNVKTHMLLQALIDDMPKTVLIIKPTWIKELMTDKMLDIILATKPSNVGGPEFRVMLQDGGLFAVPVDRGDYLASVRLSQFLELPHELQCNYLQQQPNYNPAIAYDNKSAFERLGSQMIFSRNATVSGWWEAAVILTIYCRLLEYRDIKRAFTIPIEPQVIYSMSLRIMKYAIDLKFNLTINNELDIKNEVVVPPPSQPIYDVRVTFCSDEGVYFFYGQMKIGPSNSDESSVETIAKSVVNTLISHIDSLPLSYLTLHMDTIMKNVIIIFYEWTDRSPDSEFNEKVLLYIRHIIKPSLDTKYKKYIHDYITQYGSSNIYYFEKKKLDTWLIPSVTIIPRLVEAVYTP